jgi:hypothetical protein
MIAIYKLMPIIRAVSLRLSFIMCPSDSARETPTYAWSPPCPSVSGDSHWHCSYVTSNSSGCVRLRFLAADFARARWNQVESPSQAA